MKKALALALSAAFGLISLTGCGGSPASTVSGSSAASAASGSSAVPATPAPASGDVVTLEFGHIQNPGHALYIAPENFKTLVEERSGGRVIVNIYPSSQLGSAREMMEQVTMGTLDMAFADASDWASALSIPQLSVFNLPFLSKDLATQSKMIQEIVPEVVPDMLKGTNLRLLTTYSNGIRQPLLKSKPIKTLEDIKGLKMRTPETKLYVDLWNALGASTVTSAWSEAYTILQQGIADAVEADDVGLVSQNLQEIGKYMSKIGHLGQSYLVLMNEDKWNSIPPDLQAIITECAAENQKKQLDDRENQGAEAEKTIAAAGVQINEISPEERDRMKAACQSIYDEYSTQYGLGDLIARMEAMNS